MAKPKKNKKSKSMITEQSSISGTRIEAEVPIIPEINQRSFETPSRKFMPTLPNCFKSLLNQPIQLVNKEPRAVIELLGEFLGISDYKSNIPAFWFLDTLASQVLKYSTNFDGQYRSIFVSWLAGEMKIIQEKNPSREAYFSEINELFCSTSLKLASGEPLLHWEVMFPNQSQDDSNDEIKEIMRRGSSIRKSNRRRKDSTSSKEIKINSDPSKVTEENQDINLQPHVPKIDPNAVLEAIIDATFEMYGSISRYALIQAAFVNPVEIHTHVLPFPLREPRKIKQPEFNDKMPTAIDKKLTSGKQTKDSKGKKKTESKEPGKSKKKKDFGIVDPPPPSMTEEEMLFIKREYILPLMESIEAQKILRSENTS